MHGQNRNTNKDMETIKKGTKQIMALKKYNNQTKKFV